MHRPAPPIRIGDSSGGEKSLAVELVRGYLLSRSGGIVREMRRGSEVHLSAQIDGGRLQFAIASPSGDIAISQLAEGSLDLALTADRASEAQRQKLQRAAGDNTLEQVVGLQAVALVPVQRADQALVDANGLVSLTPRPLDTAPRTDMPAPYRELVENGQRISIAFRFDSGGNELDARARQDVARPADFLQQEENRGRKIALVGFSDRQRRDSMA